MKVVILDVQNAKKLIDLLMESGYDDFVVFGKLSDCYSVKGVRIVWLNGLLGEGTSQKLLKIKGSLTRSFMVVYSFIDIDFCGIVSFHKQGQRIVTLIENQSYLVGAILEPEILDYVEDNLSLEKEIFQKIGQDGELQKYK